MNNLIELNNKRHLKIEQIDGGVLLTYYAANNDIEKIQVIESKDFIMLLNYYYFKKENTARIIPEDGEGFTVFAGEMF